MDQRETVAFAIPVARDGGSIQWIKVPMENQVDHKYDKSDQIQYGHAHIGGCRNQPILDGMTEQQYDREEHNQQLPTKMFHDRIRSIL
mmetsp:Transcript_9576/g.23510  ORF Transcript_9576/g.23510 Transcript_9576/m.23510 type:complete len:88 (-) Transcript_9576:218-481(-)